MKRTQLSVSDTRWNGICMAKNIHRLFYPTHLTLLIRYINQLTGLASNPGGTNYPSEPFLGKEVTLHVLLVFMWYGVDRMDGTDDVLLLVNAYVVEMR
jgi:hypothetical protein